MGISRGYNSDQGRPEARGRPRHANSLSFKTTFFELFFLGLEKGFWNILLWARAQIADDFRRNFFSLVEA